MLPKLNRVILNRLQQLIIRVRVRFRVRAGKTGKIVGLGSYLGVIFLKIFFKNLCYLKFLRKIVLLMFYKSKMDALNTMHVVKTRDGGSFELQNR